MPDASVDARPNRLATFFGYVLMVAIALAVFLAVRHFGERGANPAAVGPAAETALPADQHTLFHVLLALATVIVVGRVFSVLFRRLGQPPVIGEVAAGIAVGPSLLGHFWPEATAYLLSPGTAPALGILAQFGVILYMFLVGLELDAASLGKQGHATIAISHASIIVPFTLGSLLALWLYPAVSDASVAFTPFALFLGVAMSITAFPVLARILSDQGISRTPLGAVALACAATDDVTAWCLLAVVVGIARAAPKEAIYVVVWTAVYIAAMFLLVRPLAPRLLRARPGQAPTEGVLTATFVLLLASALTTEIIGIHALFGAFMLGAIIPHDSGLAQDIRRKLDDFVSVLLLPAFFALTGMRTEIGLVASWRDWLLTAVIIVVATVGKFGGACGAARLTGLPWRESASLGALMNTRGLMELIVLNVGLDLRVISPRLFAMMVIMALVTTMTTTPLVRRLWPRGQVDAV